MRDLGRKQADLISAGDMNALLRLIAAKNQLMVALQSIETQLAPFHAEDPDSRQWESPEKRAASGVLAAECNQLLEEVMVLERDNEEKMTHKRDQVVNQLQVAQAATIARGAYQAQQQLRGPHTRPTNPALAPSTTDSHTRLDIHSEA